jgi:hypothetical protein
MSVMPQTLFLLVATGMAQKSFQVLDPKGGNEDVMTLNISLVPKQTEKGADTTAVSIYYDNVPNDSLFYREYSDAGTAQGVFDDFSKIAAGVEGLLKQEKFDEARGASEALHKKFLANKGDTPMESLDKE